MEVIVMMVVIIVVRNKRRLVSSTPDFFDLGSDGTGLDYIGKRSFRVSRKISIVCVQSEISNSLHMFSLTCSNGWEADFSRVLYYAVVPLSVDHRPFVLFIIGVHIITCASTLRSTSSSQSLHITRWHAFNSRLRRLHHRCSRASWTCA